MKVPKAKGRLRGKQPKLTTKQGRHLLELIDAGTHSTAELAELFSVGRSTVYRTVRRLPHYQSSPRGRSLIRQSPDAEPATRIRWPSLVRRRHRRTSRNGAVHRSSPDRSCRTRTISCWSGKIDAMLISQVSDCII
jgi:hypothetical protein